jgi:hypothetical protein
LDGLEGYESVQRRWGSQRITIESGGGGGRDVQEEYGIGIIQNSSEEHEKAWALECGGITEKPWKKIEENRADVEEMREMP